MDDSTQSTNSKGETEQDVAIIGLSCRFAGDAKDTSGLWELLRNAKGAFTQRSRFDASGVGQSPHAACYLQDDVYQFDSRFFDISPKEAKAMDPSQRLMLEVTYEAFESAGLTLDAIAGTDTSVFAAQWTCDYREMVARDLGNAPSHTVTGTGTTLLSNRLSWFFDLRGPSFTVNTACSSGMVALHQGCESIRRGESNMAIIAGANLILSEDMFVYLRMQNFLSPSGKCKSFDASGDGYGRGEGIACIILKSVSAAIRDGDPIRAVIRGTGLNQNGRTNGITMPSSQAQMALIEQTYQSAGLPMHETCYVEAHGTGTVKGDLAESEAIGQTIGFHRSSSGKELLVGSMKPNIGHTEACAGLASVIKSVLILEKGLVPPNIYLEIPNPALRFDEWNIKVPTQLETLPTESLRRISICSTGYAGTNAHAILDDTYHYLRHRRIDDGLDFTLTNDEQKGRLKATESQGKVLVVVNANDEHSARGQLLSLARWCEARQDTRVPNLFADIVFTLNHKRSSLPWKVPVVASTFEEFGGALDNVKKSPSAIKRALTDAALCFVFSGQGAQWARMGQDLYEESDVFRESVDAADLYFQQSLHCSWSVKEEMFREDSVSNIHDHRFSQPLTTVLQIGLVDLLQSWNVKPDRIVGHSSGEIAAAYCFGALTRQDAWRIAYHCGNFIIEEEGKGAMMAVGISETEADKLIAKHTPGRVVVACINSPHSVTLAGDGRPIEVLEEVFEKSQTPTQRLKVDVAYHTRHVEPVAAAYWSSIADIRPAESHPGRTMFSTVTGKEIHASELGPWYWVRNILSPVRFSTAVSQMLESGSLCNTICLEIGPHQTMLGSLKQISSTHRAGAFEYCSTMSRGRNSSTSARTAAGTLLSLGVPVDVAVVNEHQPRGKLLVDLPPYAWRHDQSFNAIDPAKQQAHSANSASCVPRQLCFGLEWVPAVSSEPQYGDPKKDQTRVVLILGPKPSRDLRQLSQKIIQHFDSVGIFADQVSWLHSNVPVKDRKCIALVEADTPLFINATAESICYLRNLVTDAGSVLWVSINNAGGCIVPGLFRTVRNEMPWSSLTCFQLSSSWSTHMVPLSRLIPQMAMSKNSDNEYRELGGALLVPRVSTEPEMDRRLQDVSAPYDSTTSSHAQILPADATYVLAGGFGGLGRSIALYLTTLGARHLCFISRSGADTQRAQDFLSQLHDLGVSVSAYKVDISDIDALRTAVAQCHKEHPKITGVVQCAMVLRDISFERMAFEQWQTSLRPKVQGSLNLAACMPPQNLDFFIMLSSFTGIFGNRTQGNYVAGCAFQDALAHEYRNVGANVTSLDLGVMRDVGYLAESDGGAVGLLKEWEEGFGLRESELRALVKMAIIGQLPAQVITGLPTETSAITAGISRPPYLDDAKFERLLSADPSSITAESPPTLPSPATRVERTVTDLEGLTTTLCQTVARSLQMAPSDIDLARSLHAHGADSLTVIDIQSWLFRELQVNATQEELTAEIPLATLVNQIMAKCSSI